MSLKNVLIIVDDIEESIKFYEELFGLRVVTRLEGNVITELMELEGGQKLVRFYDPSGNLIEVRTPVKYKE